MYDPIKLFTNFSLKLDQVISLLVHKDENFQKVKTDKLLTKEECMEILSCNERTLRYYIYEKKSLCPTRIGRTNMVKESELKRFIDSQTRNS